MHRAPKAPPPPLPSGSPFSPHKPSCTGLACLHATLRTPLPARISHGSQDLTLVHFSSFSARHLSLSIVHPSSLQICEPLPFAIFSIFPALQVLLFHLSCSNSPFSLWGDSAFPPPLPELVSPPTVTWISPQAQLADDTPRSGTGRVSRLPSPSPTDLISALLSDPGNFYPHPYLKTSSPIAVLPPCLSWTAQGACRRHPCYDIWRL